MDTWNTITKASRTRLNRALFVLETLCNEENILVLEHFRNQDNLTLADLYSKTAEAPAKLEMRLDALCDTGCVTYEAAASGNIYRLNPERISRINVISRRINQIREEALHEQGVS